MNWTLSGGILWCVAIVALQGCTVDATPTNDEDKEGIGAISSALNPPCDPAIYDSCTPEDDDWSGSVHTAIFVCKLQNSTVSPTGNFAGATCPVPTDYALIGGGAVVEGFAQPGALLEASYPFDKSQWLATSRDLAVPFPHQIRAWAVGLRINGLSGNALRNIVTHTDTVTPSAQPVSGFALVPSGHVLVGGGVVAPPGQRITHSFPLPPSAAGWLGAFTNPVASSPGPGVIVEAHV